MKKTTKNTPVADKAVILRVWSFESENIFIQIQNIKALLNIPSFDKYLMFFDDLKKILNFLLAKTSSAVAGVIFEC